jgi:D-alanine-D-alanine ligase-like ATP-grasp enzyme
VNRSACKFTLGVVYEISENPLLGPGSGTAQDRLAEYANPTEVNRLVRSFKDMGFGIEIIDGPLGLIESAQSGERTYDLLFNKSIGFVGLERKISVPAICQIYNLPFVGTSAYPMTLARHKFHTNRLIHGLSIKVPKAVLLTHGGTVDLSSFRFPVIVKPNHESDAIGIDENSLCDNEKLALERAKRIIDKFSQPAIIEEFIGGEEWKVSVIDNGRNARSTGLVGVMRNGKPIINSLQTRGDVVENTLDYYVPASNCQTIQASDIAVYLHNTLELQDYSRTDFRIGEDGELYCMEVSTHPDISFGSSFVIAAQQSFSNYDAVMRAIIDSACHRYGIRIPVSEEN